MKWYFLQSWLLWIPAFLLGLALGYLLFRAQWRAVKSTSSSTSSSGGASRSGAQQLVAGAATGTTAGAVADLSPRVKELEQSLAARTADLGTVTDERERRAKELAALQFEHSGLKSSLIDRDAQLEKMRAELASTKSTSGDAQGQATRVLALTGEVDAHKKTIASTAAEHAAALAALKADHERSLASLRADHDKSLQSATASTKSTGDAALGDLRAENERALHDVRAERDRTLSGLRADHEKAIADLRRRADAAEADLVQCRAAHASVKSELDSHATRIQGLTGDLNVASANLAASTAELGRLRPRVVDDLERVEGIGPAFNRALQSSGIKTFEQLRDADESTLRSSIQKAGLNFAPSLPTWSRQSAFLAAGDEAGFAKYTEYLIAGQDPEKWTNAQGGDGAFGQGVVSATDEGSDGPDVTADDLARIEGIGPKISEALQAAGIKTFQRLSRSGDDRLRAAIEKAGMSFAPSLGTWAQQAGFLARGDEAGFQALADSLVAGRRETGA